MLTIECTPLPESCGSGRPMVDHTGKSYGKLKVIGFAGYRGRHHYWWFTCECNPELPFQTRIDGPGRNLTSCKKCSIVDSNVRRTKHGHARKSGKRTSEHRIWSSLVQRCNNENYPGFHYYGGRGIKICDRWRGPQGFENFLADMGPRPSQQYSLYRFPDNDGNYEPTNCRWATRYEQNRNKRNNVMITHNGTTLCLRDWSRITGIPQMTIHYRLKRGLSYEQALSPDLQL